MRRRLIVRPGAIGDFLVSLPAIETLRADFTEVWVARQNVPLVRFADRVRAIPDTGLDLFEISGPRPELLETLRSFDSIVSWYGANRDQFRSAVTELKLPIHLLPALPRDLGRHAIDFYLEQVGARAGVAPAIPVPPVERTYAVMHPFSGGKRKNWPLERFREIAGIIEPRMPVRWCSGPEEELAGAVRIDDLYELACWLAGARVYIGNDSGPTHLAAAVGTPVIALFGPTDPAIWAPRGDNVHVVSMSDPDTNQQVLSLVQQLS